jgi:hypothetical protein
MRLRDYGYKLSKVPLLCDNESAIRMADNPVEHSCTKHIDIRYHFLRDHQQRGDIEIAFVSTKEQLADIFTKPLDEKTFTKLRNELNILDSRNFDWNIAHIDHFSTFDHISFILVQMQISYCLCTKAMTNLYSSVFLLSHIEKEMESSATTRLPLHSIGINYPSPSLHSTPNWYKPFTLIYLYQWGESLKGLSKVSVFGNSCQRGREY